MANIIQFPVPIPVTNGNLPQFKFAIFGDNLATVTTAGYLNQANIAAGMPLSNADVIMALYSFNSTTQSGTFVILTVAINSSTGLITLTEWNSASGGSVTLPTIANYISHFTNTTGNMSSAAANIINAGNIQAGLSGTAGTLASFPPTAANGSLILAATNAGGAFNTTISNGTMAQSCVYTIPDVTAATGQLLAKTAAFVNGNLVQASGTAGVCVDSGVATTNVQLKTEVKAAQTADIGGGGAGPINVVVAGLTAASVVVASIVSSSNTVAVAKVAPGSGSFDITFTADPGAACVVSYIAYIASQ